MITDGLTDGAEVVVKRSGKPEQRNEWERVNE